MGNIGIFSGTFDPVHDGHVAFALRAQQQARLDRVVFIAEPRPRRKRGVTVLKHRENMLGLALQGKAHVELLRTPWQTVHTVRGRFTVVTNTYGENNDYCLLMGGDAFCHIEQWDENGSDKGGYRDIVTLVSFIVALRAGDDCTGINVVKKRIGARVTLINSPLPTCSSSRIRNDVMANQKPNGIDLRVYDYIKQNELYLCRK